MSKIKSASFVLAIIIQIGPQGALANNVAENGAWQFRSSIDMVNRAYLEDMRQKKVNDYYSPPNVTNNIDKQFNCNVSASASGNMGTSSVVTAGPSTTGNGAVAKANEATSSVQDRAGGAADSYGMAGNTASNSTAWSDTNLANLFTRSGTNGISADLSNTGQVGATAQGDTSSVVGDTANYQALNSTQTNSGAQNANVDGSSGCNFAAVN